MIMKTVKKTKMSDDDNINQDDTSQDKHKESTIKVDKYDNDNTKYHRKTSENIAAKYFNSCTETEVYVGIKTMITKSFDDK